MVMVVRNYIGCDISKDNLDFFDSSSGRHSRIANQAAAIAAHVEGLSCGRDFVVMEATGLHDRLLRHALAAARIGFSRLNPRHVHHHGKAGRQRAKTDRQDAVLLAGYGRAHEPAADPAPNGNRERLQELVRRREQLVDAKADNSKQLKTAVAPDVRADIQATIEFLDGRIDHCEALIKSTLAEADHATAADYDILVSAPGVSFVTATTLIAMLPELGSRSPKTIAALAGLAPFDKQSGKKTFKSQIQGGRQRVRRALYMAALSASRHCPQLARFYASVATRSGAKKLALIAVARKLLVRLNAMIRDQKRYA